MEEEDNIQASDDSDAEDAKKIINHAKKNFLCKSLVEQCKELCYSNSLVYKDFDQIYQKIIYKFNQWTIFDDDEIS